VLLIYRLDEAFTSVAWITDTFVRNKSNVLKNGNTTSRQLEIFDDQIHRHLCLYTITRHERNHLDAKVKP
jgi:hypothetical protein